MVGKRQLLLYLGAILLFVAAVLYLERPDLFTRYPIPEPVQAKVYFEVGQYYFNHDDDPGLPYDRELARKYYTKAAELDPTVHPSLWYQLGRLAFLDSRFNEALRLFGKQKEYFGEAVPGVLYMEGLTYGYKASNTNDPADWRKAELGFINYIPYAPAAPWPRVDLAWIYFAQGKYQEMIPVLEDGLQTHANNPWLHNMYGLALLNTDQPDEALQHFMKAQAEAARVSEAQWGTVYPGNHPADWGKGLEEFRAVIAKNIELAKSSSQ